MAVSTQKKNTAPERRASQPRTRRSRWPRLIGALVALDAVLLAIRLSLGPATSPLPSTPEWIDFQPLPINEYSRPGTPLEKINGIVVHYVGNPGTTAAQNHSYFDNLAQTGETYASSHFLVGLDGEIIQNIPLNEIAYCSNQRNEDTLSIECCHPDEEGRFTPATYASLIRLVCWLSETYDLDTDQIIRHYDVTGKECPRWYVRHPEDWAAFLSDVAAAAESAP